MLANESQAGPWVLQWNHGKIESMREGVVIIVWFRLGSVRLDIEDPTKSAFGVGKLREWRMPCPAKGKDEQGVRPKM